MSQVSWISFQEKNCKKYEENWAATATLGGDFLPTPKGPVVATVLFRWRGWSTLLEHWLMDSLRIWTATIFSWFALPRSLPSVFFGGEEVKGGNEAEDLMRIGLWWDDVWDLRARSAVGLFALRCTALRTVGQSVRKECFLGQREIQDACRCKQKRLVYESILLMKHYKTRPFSFSLNFDWGKIVPLHFLLEVTTIYSDDSEETESTWFFPSTCALFG